MIFWRAVELVSRLLPSQTKPSRVEPIIKVGAAKYKMCSCGQHSVEIDAPTWCGEGRDYSLLHKLHREGEKMSVDEFNALWDAHFGWAEYTNDGVRH